MGAPVFETYAKHYFFVVGSSECSRMAAVFLPSRPDSQNIGICRSTDDVSIESNKSLFSCHNPKRGNLACRLRRIVQGEDDFRFCVVNGKQLLSNVDRSTIFFVFSGSPATRNQLVGLTCINGRLVCQLTTRLSQRLFKSLVRNQASEDKIKSK